jgi:hypothetical protein
LTFTPWSEQIEAGVSIVNLLCPTDTTGSISLSLVGGDGNYTVLWSNGATGTQFDSLAAGDYMVQGAIIAHMRRQ